MKNKKILTFLLISFLFITGCFNNASSVSSMTSSSNISVTTSITQTQQLSQILISAPTDQLIQNVTDIKTISVSSSLNSGTDSIFNYEWYVNGVKSVQTGTLFEFTPNKEGKFDIQLLVNRVASNILSVAVNKADLIIDNVRFLNSRVLELKAPAGMSFKTKTDNLVSSQEYDYIKNVYLLNLNRQLGQGEKITVEGFKDNFNTWSKEITFDTRSIKISTVTINNAITSFKENLPIEINKPHYIQNNGVKTDTSFSNVLKLNFSSKDLNGTNLNYEIENTLNPVGSTRAPRIQGLVSVLDNNAGNVEFEFRVNTSTVAGLYSFRFTISNTSFVFSIKVNVPVQEVSLNDIVISDEKFGVIVSEGLKDNPNITSNQIGIQGEANKFTIIKNSLNYEFKLFVFSVKASNFNVPDNLIDNSSINPNQLQVTLTTPDGSTQLRTSGVNQLTMPSIVPMRSFVENLVVSQRIDESTPIGIYTYRFKVLQAGLEIYSKDILIEIVDPKKEIEFITSLEDENKDGENSFEIELESISDTSYVFEVGKPSRANLDLKTVRIDAVIKNYESSINLGGSPSVTYIGRTQVGDDQTIRDLVPFIKTYTGPSTINSNLNNSVNTRVGLEIGQSVDLDGYTTVNENNIRVVTNRLVSDETEYLFYRANNSDEIIINDTFVFEIDYLTSPGTYRFKLVVGALEKEVEIIVLPSNPRIDLSITSDFIVDYDENNTYYLNMNKEDSIDVIFGLEILNVDLPSNGTLFLRLETDTPDLSGNVFNSNIVVSEKPGNDGHLLSPALVSQLQGGESSLNIAKTGVYRYKIGYGVVSTEIRLVVQPYPTLEIVDIIAKEELIVRFFDDNYIINSNQDQIELEISVKTVNLTDETYYKSYNEITDFEPSVELDQLTLLDFNTEKEAIIEYVIDTFEFNGDSLLVYEFYIALFQKDIENEELFKLVGHKKITVYLTDLE